MAPPGLRLGRALAAGPGTLTPIAVTFYCGTMLTVREETVTLPQGLRVHVERCGEGEPIVLLHGIAHSSRAWNRLLVPLAERRHVVAIDLPGCGRSDKPDTDYSLGNQAAAVRHILDALGLDLVTPIGHSLGGGVALTFAWQYPERCGRVGLIASGGLGRELHPLFRLATLPVVPEQVMRVGLNRCGRPVRDRLGGLLGRPFFAPGKARAEEVAELLRPLEDPAAQRAFLAMLRSASGPAGQRISALDRLGCAEFPVLLLWGREDAVFPVAHAERAARLVPSARLHVIDGCGHFPQVEATAETLRVIGEWLDETSPVRVDVSARGRAAARLRQPTASPA